MTEDEHVEATKVSRKTGELLRCSFCGRSQPEVEQLATGPDADICDRCIHDGLETIAPPDDDEYEEVVEVTLAELIADVERVHGEFPKTKTRDPLRCSFCGRSQLEVNQLVAGPGVYICDQCLHLSLEAIESLPEDR